MLLVSIGRGSVGVLGCRDSCQFVLAKAGPWLSKSPEKLTSPAKSNAADGNTRHKYDELQKHSAFGTNRRKLKNHAAIEAVMGQMTVR